MQIGKINSASFGNRNYTEMLQPESDDAKKLATMLREYDEFVPTLSDDNGDEPVKKGLIATAASVALGALMMFGIAKKGYNGAQKILSNIADSKQAQKIAAKASEVFSSTKIGGKAAEIAASVQNSLSKNAQLSKIGDIAKRIGAGNIVAGATSIAATSYVATTDGNNNGVADIAERGVNAYTNAVKGVQAANEVLQLIA